MKPTDQANTDDRFISIRELASEFKSNREETRKWLMLNDFSVERRFEENDDGAVLTGAEADQARYLKQHGILLERVRD